MAHNFLQQFYPKLLSSAIEPMDNDDYQPHLQRTIKRLKVQYPFAVEPDANKVSTEIISILAMEDWNEQVQRTRVCAPDQKLERIEVYKQLIENYSLIGASSLEMALATMKNALDSLVSAAMCQGRASDETVWDSTTKAAFHKLRKIWKETINALWTLMYKTSDKFEEMVVSIEALIRNATSLGAMKLKSKCEDFIGLAKKKDKKGCQNVLVEIEAEGCDMYHTYDAIIEVLELIEIVEMKIDKVES